jgi:hypothetical protein
LLLVLAVQVAQVAQVEAMEFHRLFTQLHRLVAVVVVMD